jgi:hypothetical protein
MDVAKKLESSFPLFTNQSFLYLTRQIGLQHFSPPPTPSWIGEIPGQCGQEVGAAFFLDTGCRTAALSQAWQAKNMGAPLPHPTPLKGQKFLWRGKSKNLPPTWHPELWPREFTQGKSHSQEEGTTVFPQRNRLFFFPVLGFELRAYTLSSPTALFRGGFFSR